MLAIGFDSGGSHTTCVMNRGQGPILGLASETGDSISNARGEQSARAAVDWICHVIRGESDTEICAWIGAAGFYGGTAAKFRQLFEAPANRLRALGRDISLFIANDAVSILKSPPLSGSGVAAVVGTGSVALGSHPLCAPGVIKRGGSEWLVSDEGAGVWMTLQCIRQLLDDIEKVGAQDYHSPLLDRLCDYFEVSASYLAEVPSSHRALARAELLSHTISEGRPDAKRRIAGFVFPHLFNLAALRHGYAHDPIAAEVLAASVEAVAKNIKTVAAEVAAHTSDQPNKRESLPVYVGGNVAANDAYRAQLIPLLSESPYIDSVETIGDAAGLFSELAWHYLNADAREQRAVTRALDPLHQVLQVL